MDEPGGRQRLDKWLWFARVVKSRTLAQKLVASGAVRVNGERTLQTDCRVGPGTVLTMSVHERLLVLRILDPGTHRGPASEAQALYEDLSPELPRAAMRTTPLAHGSRERGSGRPTKRERRDTDRFRRGGETE